MRFPPLPAHLAIAITLTILSGAAEAHLPWPATRAIESGDGQFILVLLMSVEDRAERREVTEFDPQEDGSLTQADLWQWEERVAREKAIEAKYPRSGLYRNDGSTELIWPSPYITVCRDVFVANDGRHVVAAKTIGSTCWDSDEPYVFYALGKKIAAHDDVATLPCIWMRFVIAKWTDLELPYDVRMALVDDTGSFVVETNQYDALTFNLATGDLVSRRSPWPYYLVALAIGPPMGLYAWRRRMRRTAATITRARRGLVFSIREILAITALFAGTLAAARLWGHVGATAAIIATCGALVARIRARAALAWIVGAIAALYAAYMTLLLSAVIDSALLDGYTLLRTWLDENSSRWLPMGVLGVAALAAAWCVSRMWAIDHARPGAHRN